MNFKWLSSVSLCAMLGITATPPTVADEAPVVDVSSSYAAQDQSPGINEAPVADNPPLNADTNLAQADNTDIVENGEADTTQAPSLTTQLSGRPIDQRVQRLEKQVTNMANMNLPQQITLLQQQVAQLRGQLEVQGHDLELANKQLRSFYQDLNTRINQMNNLNSGNSSNSPPGAQALKTPTSVELQDANAYQVAFNQLVNHQLDKAKQSFDGYLNQYPNGKYVADAHYWLGELYLTGKAYKNANAEFETVLNKYPTSSKVSDAKLKIAIIHASLGKVEQAKNELQLIKKTHPDSTAAQLANIRLQQLNEGVSSVS